MVVFVYGTLRNGESNHQVMVEDAKGVFLGFTKIEGCVGNIVIDDITYPALTVGKKLGIVHGELYSVNNYGLNVLDEFEEVDRGFYKRILHTSTDGLAVWVYVLDSIEV